MALVAAAAVAAPVAPEGGPVIVAIITMAAPLHAPEFPVLVVIAVVLALVLAEAGVSAVEVEVAEPGKQTQEEPVLPLVAGRPAIRVAVLAAVVLYLPAPEVLGVHQILVLNGPGVAAGAVE